MSKSVIVLTLVCIIAAGLLGVTYIYTKDKIESQADLALADTLKEVFPNADDFEADGENYIAFRDGEIIGEAIVVESQGYSSVLRLLVGVDINNQITEVRVLFQEETPGLGSNIEKPEFYSQFNGLGQDNIALKKDGGEIDAITGATISTDAMIVGVRKAFGEEVEKIEEPDAKVDAVTEATPEAEYNETQVDVVTTATPGVEYSGGSEEYEKEHDDEDEGEYEEEDEYEDDNDDEKENEEDDD